MRGTERFSRALDLFDGVVRLVPPAAWGASSPCAKWTAAGVVGHVASGLAMVRAVLDGGLDAPAPAADPGMAAGLDPAIAWQAAYRQTRAWAWSSDRRAAVSGPTGAMTADDALGQASVELLVHGWDLAQATGVRFAMPDELVVPLLNALEPLDEVIRPGGLYGDRLPVPSDATPQERLLAFLGRPATPPPTGTATTVDR